MLGVLGKMYYLVLIKSICFLFGFYTNFSNFNLIFYKNLWFFFIPKNKIKAFKKGMNWSKKK
jgi:hypothetical protein